MSKIEAVAIADIHVPERLREVDMDHVYAIQTSIVERGLLNPITVRRTPNAKGGKFTLVAGAHRLKAISENEETEIDAIIVEADKLTAVLMEIEENLFRNDLSALDRAIFVQTYREVWEQKHGKIKRGGDQSANFALCPVDVLQEEAERGFAVHCAERLGCSKRTIYMAQEISSKLPRDIRRRLHGTPAADNQSALLKLAKLPADKLANAAKVFDTVEGDFDKMMEALGDPKPKQSAADQLRSRLIDTWGRVKPKDRIAFVRD
ncbi:ParB N-terminal domain-containing protein [Oricola indica]|uniref:ParB N-terminal domain-containing protein n=1 Tax=Oricola indica TaxID=2872591 RepID=UPI003CCB75BD